MGFFSSLWDKAVSVVKSVGRVVVEGAKKLLGMSETTQNQVSERVEKVVVRERIIERVIPAEELGYKVFDSNRNINEFNSTSDFIKAIDAEIDVKKDELENLDLNKKRELKALGTSLYNKALEEAKDISIPIEFWKEAVDRGMSAKEIDFLINKFKEEGISPQDFVDYFKGNLNLIKKDLVKSAIIKAYKELEPNISEEEIEKKVMLERS